MFEIDKIVYAPFVAIDRYNSSIKHRGCRQAYNIDSKLEEGQYVVGFNTKYKNLRYGEFDESKIFNEEDRRRLSIKLV